MTWVRWRKLMLSVVVEPPAAPQASGKEGVIAFPRPMHPCDAGPLMMIRLAGTERAKLSALARLRV